MYTSVCCGDAGRAWAIWYSTTPLIVSESKPLARAFLKA